MVDIPAERALQSADEGTATGAAAVPATSLMPIPTPALAGSEPCVVGPSLRLFLADAPPGNGTTDIAIGFGPAEGLAVWQVESNKVHTQRLDLAGKPIGSPSAFDAPRSVILKQVRPLSDGFVILANDFSEGMDHPFVWVADAAGHLSPPVDLDVGPHFLDAVSPVVNDRMLLFLSNDRLTNQSTSRIMLLTFTQGRAQQQSFDFPVVTPIYQAAAVELALGAREWAVWFLAGDQPAQLLSSRGQRAAPLLELPITLFTDYHTVRLRYLGDRLKVLTAIEDAPAAVVINTHQGTRYVRGEEGKPTLLRVDTLEANGTLRAGVPFEYVPGGELPAPFSNQLDLSFDSKVAKRSTLVGVHALGAPISLESVSPPISDPFVEASAAWSSTHWVIAYWSKLAAGGSMNALAIRCGP